LTAFELWHGTRSCWNVLLPSAKVCRNGKTLLFRISMHFDQFIMSSTGTRLPGPLSVKKLKTFFKVFYSLQSCSALTDSSLLRLTTLAL
jgi:hypothetical protein